MPLEEKENEILARIQSPGKYDPDSIRRKPFPPNNPERGVFALYGCPKGEWSGGRCQVGVQIQSFRFSKDAGWTLAKARAWLKAHDFTVTAELKLNYLASITVEGDHYARIYLIDTSVCGNNWEVTDEALERAAKTLIGKPLMIGHGAPEGSAIGTFVDCLKPDGRLYGLAKITDEDAWKRIEAGEWGATSVEFMAKKIICSVCGADLTAGSCEHILNRTGHEVIEDFVFETVGLVEHPAYPRAKVEEMNGIGDVWPKKTLLKERPLPKFPNAHDHTVHAETITYHNETGTWTDGTETSTYFELPWCEFSRKLTAELDLRRVHDQPVKTVESKQNGGKKVTEEKQEIRIAELEEQLKEVTNERDELKAKLEEMEKAQHEAKVAALLGLREKAGLVKKADLKAEAEKLGKLPDAAIDQLAEDAKKFEPTGTSTPRPKIRAGESLSAMEETRKQLFGYTRDKPASDGGKIIG